MHCSDIGGLCEAYVPTYLAIELRARSLGPNFHIKIGAGNPMATAKKPRRLVPHPYPSALYI